MTNTDKRKDRKDIGEAFASLVQTVRAEAGKELVGVPWPIAALNRITRGIRPPYWLSVIGAGPGVGKSLLALQVVWCAILAGFRVCFVSTEMAAKALLVRFIALALNTSWDDVERGNLTPRQWSDASDVVERLQSYLALYTDATTIEQLEDIVEEEGKCGTAIFIVDYLQDIMVPNVTGIFDRTSAVVERLREKSKKAGKPTVLFSQLSSEDTDSIGAGWRGGKDVYIRGDIAVLIRRAKENDDWLEADIKKHRHGRRGKIALKYTDRYNGIVERELQPKPSNTNQNSKA